MTRRDAPKGALADQWMKCQPCGKRAYFSRKAARAHAKQIPGDHMNTYRCPYDTGWHLGHLPDEVRHGALSKDIYLGRERHRAGRRADGAA